MLRLSNVSRMRRFSTKVDLKELLQRMSAENAKKVEQKNSTVKISTSPGSTSTPSLADALKKFTFDKKPAAANPAPSPEDIPPPSGSIRDAFRRAEEKLVAQEKEKQERFKQKQWQFAQNEAAKRQVNQQTPGMSSQAIRDDVLNAAKTTESGTGIQEEEDNDDYTEGEYRHEKRQQKIAINRSRYAQDTEPITIPTKVSTIISPEPKGFVDFAELKRQLQMNVQAQRGSQPTAEQQKKAEMNAANAKRKQEAKSMGISFKDLLAMRKEQAQQAKESAKEVVIPAKGIFLKDLAELLGKKVEKLARAMERLGENVEKTKVTVKKIGKKKIKKDQVVDEVFVDADVAEIIALDYGMKVSREVDEEALQEAKPSEKADGSGAGSNVVLMPRAPIVCVMGHVDHGKTTLLDGLRNLNRDNQIAAAAVSGSDDSSSSGKNKKKAKKNGEKKAESVESEGEEKEPELISVAAGEAGGITQKLSAFSVTLSDERRAVFLDTPGHAAFSAMRAHGALATDLVVLVVALDDGVRPQTIEAIKTAQEAKCNIIIALNKVDKFHNPDDRQRARERVLTQLVEHELVAEEFGGPCEVVEVSGKSGENLPELVDSIMLQADVMELTAAREGQAEAVVLDAHLDRGMGVVAEVLVKWGSLSVGDAIVVGSSHGKVRSMTNDRGEEVKTAYPSDSVRMTGLKTVPSNGQEMLSVINEARARVIADRRRIRFENRKQAELDRLQENKRAMEEAQRKALLDAATEFDDDGNPIITTVVPVVPKVNVILKADGTGTVDALSQVVKGVASRTNEVLVNVVHAGVGAVNQNDVNMADVSGDCEILAFNVGLLDAHTRMLAKECEVHIETSDIVYRLEEQLIKKMGTMMPIEKVFTREVSQNEVMIQRFMLFVCLL